MYYIAVWEAASLMSDSFEEKTIVSTSGFHNTSVLIEGLWSCWNYTFKITAATPVGNSSAQSLNGTVRTKESVPSQPKEFWAFVNRSSDVTLFWVPAEHQDGPTTYYIRVMEETSLNSGTFAETEFISVKGFHNTSVLIEGLRSYWMYNFSITAATSCGNSSVLSVNASVQTKESAPGYVEHIHIHHVQDNYTSAEVFFSCPNETERHGIIKYYILSYEAQEKYASTVLENPQGVNISAQPESNCNYSLVVPVTAQVIYNFSVQAYNKYEGKKSTKSYITPTGVSGPVASFDAPSKTAHSITIQWTKPSLPNGNILGYRVNVTSGGKSGRVINVTCDQIKKQECRAVETSITKSNAVVNGDGNGQYDYNITNLLSYTNYTIVVSCVNINGTGEESIITVQTNMTVTSPPRKFWASVNSSSSVTLFWTHADHQDGPTTYYITVGEAANLTSDIFQENMVVSVSGFYSTSVLVEGLRSYWKYTFNIRAATPLGNSSVLSLNETVRTKESKEKYNNSVEKYTTNVTENPQGLMISAQPDSKCTYSLVVSVTAQVNYMFSVVAHDSFPGSETTEHYFAKTGTPGKVSDFTSTSTTSTSISLSWEPPTYPNGYILGYALYVHTEDGKCQQAVYIVCTDCQSHGTFRVEDDRCRRSRNVTVQKLETSPTNYNVTTLLSYTNYTFTVAALNNFSMGINTSLAVQTVIGVPSVPGNLSASVVNASSVEVTWTPPTHKSGPTNYTIIPQQATGRLSSTFENIRNVTVNGYKSSKTTINSLLSSWRYTFSIVASTSKGGSLPVDLGSNIITQESQPCEVQNLKVLSITGNFTAVHLAWDCPKETERNGFIRNYTIQYSDSV
ncbi:phosphatidylinositol phosphatase PTPRQ-like [Haliotis rubra]|uniref:phosphatidylinositol phosphatase PTPRQ-like n=1 Tax=Haliotis rubra TaxID=36100 RepID=UPI001EE50813|nr:phosphatidylinositol phosphatase PTPRQ-like [Haliotis rubra]